MVRWPGEEFSVPAPKKYPDELVRHAALGGRVGVRGPRRRAVAVAR
jgi:hypothetical protein